MAALGSPFFSIHQKLSIVAATKTKGVIHGMAGMGPFPDVQLIGI